MARESRVWGPYLVDTSFLGYTPERLFDAWRARALHACDRASDRAEARFWLQLAHRVASVINAV